MKCWLYVLSIVTIAYTNRLRPFKLEIRLLNYTDSMANVNRKSESLFFKIEITYSDVLGTKRDFITTDMYVRKPIIEFKGQLNPRRRNPIILFVKRNATVYVVISPKMNKHRALIFDVIYVPNTTETRTWILSSLNNTLSISITIACRQQLFGKICDKYCKVSRNDVYQCSPLGEKECRPRYMNMSSNCTQINPCYSNPCANDGICQLLSSGKPSCKCKKPYEGPFCKNISPCTDNFCANGGTCVSGEIKNTCSCPPNWRGNKCKEDVNECLTIKCQNKGICKNQPGTFTCECSPDYKGKLCEKEEDDCRKVGCLNRGICQNHNGECLCSLGYRGKRCDKSEVNICNLVTCENGGTCQNLTGAKFKCLCKDAFVGERCEKMVHACLILNCRNNAICKKNSNREKFICECPPGYQGRLCENDTNECLNIKCQNGGVCENRRGDFKCICLSGYEGQRCENKIKGCDSVKCENDGVCTRQSANITCLCKRGFEGDRCEKDVDECKRYYNLCNHGKCINRKGSYECKCTPPYHGPACLYCGTRRNEKGECQSPPKTKKPKNPMTTWIAIGVSAFIVAIICITGSAMVINKLPSGTLRKETWEVDAELYE